MSKPLFTQDEIDTYEARLKRLEKVDRKSPSFKWDAYWAERDGLRRAQETMMVRRAQERPDEFLNALLVLVGNRGAYYIPFDNAFAESGSKEITAAVLQHDTPENRRTLYTILRALTEIPKSWAMSATARFLRGTGKQKGAKYHGAGMLGTDYGWKTKEVGAILNIIVAGEHYPSGYSKCLMDYEDAEQEVRDAINEEEESGDYTIDYGTVFKATRIERDIEFINELCDNLEARGLAPVPRPKTKKPKKKRKPKQFKSGDKIRRATIRDLPLPAHVRIPILRRDQDSTEWVEAHIEHVVLKLTNDGRYHEAKVNAKGDKAYQGKGRYILGTSKDYLEGATYLGPWKGQLVKQDLNYNFYMRRRPK